MHATGRSCHSIRVVPVKNKREWSIREIILPGENRKILWEKFPQYEFVQIEPTMTGLETNPCLSGTGGRD
jgi:hypothetical protein